MPESEVAYEIEYLYVATGNGWRPWRTEWDLHTMFEAQEALAAILADGTLDHENTTYRIVKVTREVLA